MGSRSKGRCRTGTVFQEEQEKLEKEKKKKDKETESEAGDKGEKKPGLLAKIFGFITEEDEDTPRLWVPPVSTGKNGRGKALVFTTMQVTTRAVTYFIDEYFQKKVEEYKTYDDVPIDKGILNCIVTDMLKILEEDESKREKAIETLCSFFNRQFVRRVICKKYSKENLGYSEAIKRYCENNDFLSMVKEYKYVLGEKYTIESLLSAFEHKSTSVIERCLKDNHIINRFHSVEYAEMFVCDDNKSGVGDNEEKEEGEKKTENRVKVEGDNIINKSLDNIRNQFNSPIYPMVLVSRNTGQEGYNLQFYGDKLVHWQMATNLNGFLQRRGRLDRPGSLVFREKVWNWVKEKTADKIGHYCQAKEYFDKEYKCSNVNSKAIDSGIQPMWNFEYNDITIKELFHIFEYDGEFKKSLTQIVAADNYSAFYDNVNELCPFLN